MATSIGAVYFYSCDLKASSEALLHQISVVDVADPSVLVLALAWSALPRSPSIIAISLSTGQVCIFDYLIPGISMRFIDAHSLEAWTIAWSKVKTVNGLPYLYSGGDDSALVVHNTYDILQLESPDTEPSIDTGYEPISRDTKTHSAGVTAILPLTGEYCTDREILVTGSYDEFLRVLLPKFPSRRTEILAEKRLDGGVWRLKQLGSSRAGPAGGKKFQILVSCMHAGARVVEVSHSAEATWSIRVLAKFEEHESMNYASDAQEEDNYDTAKTRRFISSSFYDKRLCVWEMKHENVKVNHTGNNELERSLGETL